MNNKLSLFLSGTVSAVMITTKKVFAQLTFTGQ